MRYRAARNPAARIESVEFDGDQLSWLRGWNWRNSSRADHRAARYQDEIRRLVVVKDYRIWPLYGKRIIEWRDGQARAAARQLVHSIGCSEHDDPTSAVHPDGSPKLTEEQPWPVESQSSGDNRSAVFAASFQPGSGEGSDKENHALPRSPESGCAD